MSVRELTSADTIADRWVARFGIGFHPDNRGCDYAPRLPRAVAESYDRDMFRLFELSDDVYAVGLYAMTRAGLL